MEEDLILAKAVLSTGGTVRIPKDYRVPVRISKSTAGPGAGNHSVVFSFNGMRVMKRISRNDGEFFFDPEKRTISKGGDVIAEDVSIIPVAFHCPGQAFFNLDQRCRLGCLFCSSPHLKVNATRDLDDDTIVSLIKESKETIYSIALTTGVSGSVEDSVSRMAECVVRLRKEFPNVPIGVEPYVDDEEQIDLLHDSGADEIKINVETATDGLFRTFCPKLERNMIFDMLAHAVEVFGRNKVSSNIIVGLGETDDDIHDIIERLCSMGVTPTIRGLRINDDVKDILSSHGVREQPSPERMVRIANIQKTVMEEHGLDPRTFDTMCLRCTCCDLVPFIDL